MSRWTKRPKIRSWLRLHSSIALQLPYIPKKHAAKKVLLFVALMGRLSQDVCMVPSNLCGGGVAVGTVCRDGKIDYDGTIQFPLGV